MFIEMVLNECKVNLNFKKIIDDFFFYIFDRNIGS